MADFPDDIKLIHMNIPGTHDTCTCMVSRNGQLFLTEILTFKGTTLLSFRARWSVIQDRRSCL